jgi:hypothetical protein
MVIDKLIKFLKNFPQNNRGKNSPPCTIKPKLCPKGQKSKCKGWKV